MTCICIEREGVPKKEVTKHRQRREGGRDIHPCWGFVAANVIAWNGAKTLGLGLLDQFSSKVGQ